MNGSLQTADQTEKDVNEIYNGPRGVGGWLAFFVFNIFMTIVICVARCIQYIPAVDAFVTCGFLWAVILDFLYHAIVLGASVTIVVYIYKRDVLFRLFYIILVSFDFVYCIFIFLIAQSFDAMLIAVLVKNVLWILYFFNSKRIKYSFIPKDQNARRTCC